MDQRFRRALERGLWGTVAVATVVALSSTARADVRTEARQHFRHGMALISEGQLEAGIAELLEAYDILPHPNALYNIARAYAEAGRYQEAIGFYEQYLESDPADRDEVEQYLGALRQRVEQQEGRSRPTDATAATTTEPTEPADVPVASDDDIRALSDSATQIEALAEAAQSDELRRRAQRLRELAASLRERATASATTEPTETTETTETEPTETTEPEEGESALVLGEGREGDTYEESVVSSSRAAESPLDAPNSTAIVTSQDLHLGGLTDPALALRRVAGVSILHTDPGVPQISIRGLNQRLSNRAIVLVDGRSVYLDFLGTTLWDLIPLAMDDIERIEVIRGPASALYGADALTGIINIITRPLGEGRNYINAGVGTGGQLQLTTSVSGRADRFRFRTTGGYWRQDQYGLEVTPSRVDITPAARNPSLGSDRLFFQGELSYRLDDGTTIRAGGGIAEGSLAFEGLSRLRQLFGSNGFFSQSFIQLNTPIGLSARVFWNRFSMDVANQGLVPGGLDFSQEHSVSRSDVIDTEAIYTATFDLGGIENTLIVGINYRFKEVEWSWLQGGLQTQHHGALFLQDTMRFSDVVQIVLSARADLHPLLNVQVSPRGSLVIHPLAGNTIRLTAGSAFRAPTFVESYLQIPNPTPIRGVTAFGGGTTNVNPERLVSIELGYMNQMTDYFTLELNGYYNIVFDQITLNQTQTYRLADFVNNGRASFQDDFAAFPLGQLNFGNEQQVFQQLGGELGGRVYPIDGLDLYANYAIHQTTPFGWQPSASVFGNDSRTSAHMINAGFQYRSPIGLDVSADFSWQSDQTWVEQVLDTERGGVAFVPFHLPSYTTLNARIGWRLFNDQLELAVVGTNLIDDGHREHPFGQRVDRRFMGFASVRF